MRALAAAVVALLASACGSGEDPPKRPNRAGWPTRPEVVAPKIGGAKVLVPEVAPPALVPSRIVPPIVRGPRQIDAFEQDEAVVDVLWVVDNSGSLNSERDRLAAQFDRFLSVLLRAGVDYHVGVTSTDLSPTTGEGGRLRGTVPWIDRMTADPRARFRDAVSFPSDSDVLLEEGLAAMAAALTPPNTLGPNRGFLRDDAALAVIVVTDEDDGSLGPSDYYVRLLRGLKGPGREANISFSAVAGPLPDGCIPPGEELVFGSEADPAERYLAVVDATGGLFESICSVDFAPFVETLATNLSGLRLVFPLSAPAVESSIEVKVDGRTIPNDPQNGWTYSETDRALTFHGRGIPPPGSEIEISYDVEV
jgi:hypothetical protein